MGEFTFFVPCHFDVFGTLTVLPFCTLFLLSNESVTGWSDWVPLSACHVENLLQEG